MAGKGDSLTSYSELQSTNSWVAPQQQQQAQQAMYPQQAAGSAQPQYVYAPPPPPGVMYAVYNPSVSAQQQVVYVPAPAPVTTGAFTYEQLEARYRAMDRAIMGLSVTQMIFWFPLGFLYFVGLTPRNGRLHMGMGVLFFLLSMVGFITLLSVTWYNCYYNYNGTGGQDYTCYPDGGLKALGFIFAPFIALSAASIGVGVRHAALEVALRTSNLQRFASTYPTRVTSNVAF